MDTTPLTDTDKNYCFITTETEQHWTMYCMAARPRSVINPTKFGLGVEFDHVFDSKWLINELSWLVFSYCL